MHKRTPFVILIALAAILGVLTPSHASGDWHGSWNTQHGELRLIQEGSRVYGDYQSRGHDRGQAFARRTESCAAPSIVMTAAGACCSSNLGADGGGWSGSWSWNDNPALADGGWNATKKSSDTPRLTQAVDAPFYWPIQMYEAPTPAFENFINFSDMGSGGDGGMSLLGSWIIKSGTDTLGTLEIVRANEAIGEVFATLRVWHSMGGTMADEGDVGTQQYTRNRLVVFMRTELGAQYRLDVELDGRDPDRLLSTFHFDGGSQPAILERAGKTEQTEAQPQEPLEGDLPAIGIYRYQYSLAGVPEGRRLVLRAGPDKTSQNVGSLPSSATGMWIQECEPYVDSHAFEQASHAPSAASCAAAGVKWLMETRQDTCRVPISSRSR